MFGKPTNLTFKTIHGWHARLPFSLFHEIYW
jgi:hypothetical protein